MCVSPVVHIATAVARLIFKIVVRGGEPSISILFNSVCVQYVLRRTRSFVPCTVCAYTCTCHIIVLCGSHVAVACVYCPALSLSCIRFYLLSSPVWCLSCPRPFRTPSVLLVVPIMHRMHCQVALDFSSPRICSSCGLSVFFSPVQPNPTP